MKTIEELKESICAECDPDLIVELLDLSAAQLLDRFEDVLEERRHIFRDFENDE